MASPQYSRLEYDTIERSDSHGWKVCPRRRAVVSGGSFTLVSGVVIALIVLLAVPSYDGSPDPPLPLEPFLYDTLTLLKGGIVYAPENIGQMDVLMSGGGGGSNETRDTGGGGCIVALMTGAQGDALIEQQSVLGGMLRVIDVHNQTVIPGLVDIHQHFIGGGGEMGPQSRTPAAVVSDIIKAGITTAIGLRGTDGVTRDLLDLLSRTKALNKDGLTAFMYTGGYRSSPITTITGDVQQDIVAVAEVVGIGELAISDHRGSQPTVQELATLVSDAYVAGLLSGKAGVTHLHTGPSGARLSKVFDVLDNSAVLVTSMHPTHIERSPELIEDGITLLGRGGGFDLTAETDDDATANILNQLSSEGVSLERVTVSSDAFGSLPVYDPDGNLLRYGVARPDTLLKVLTTMVLKDSWPLSAALPFFTTNPARVMHLEKKGTIQVGNDADVVVLDRETLEIRYVFANGKTMMTPSWVYKGMFET